MSNSVEIVTLPYFFGIERLVVHVTNVFSFLLLVGL